MSEQSAKVMYVTRRTEQSKTVRVAMTDGRYGKNEIEITWTGLPPGKDIDDIVDQAWHGMDKMQKMNSRHLEITSKTDKLPAAKELP